MLSVGHAAAPATCILNSMSTPTARPGIPSESPVSVLVVDDYEAHRYANVRALREAGLNAFGVATGKEALESARRDRPDVIVLDIHLPDILGFEVCRLLKEDPETSGIPVLFLTATATSERAADVGKELGASAFLFDPIEGDTLVTVVQAAHKIKLITGGRFSNRGTK
jgi:CheY-like chemotaxis protein